MRGLTDHLFAEADWHTVAEKRREAMGREIMSMVETQILNTSVDDLCSYLVKKYSIDVPTLDENGIHADQQDVQVDVSGDPMRVILDRNRPVYVSGTMVEVFVPFAGEHEAFRISPTTFTFSPPRAIVRPGELVLQITGANLNGEQVKARIQSSLNEIKTHLDRLRTDATVLAGQLHTLARQQVEARRQKFLADRNLVASLGFPLRRRDDMSQTYRAPEVRRRVQLRPPAATSAPACRCAARRGPRGWRAGSTSRRRARRAGGSWREPTGARNEWRGLPAPPGRMDQAGRYAGPADRGDGPFEERSRRLRTGVRVLHRLANPATRSRIEPQRISLFRRAE
jgi:hypothetical protein